MDDRRGIRRKVEILVHIRYKIFRIRALVRLTRVKLNHFDLIAHGRLTR